MPVLGSSRTERIINFTNRCDEILFPLSIHCVLGTFSLASLKVACTFSGLANEYFVAFHERVVASKTFDEEFTQKFFKKSVDQALRFIPIQIPFTPFIRFRGTPERAHAIGLFFLNLGLNIAPFCKLALKVAAIVSAAFLISTSARAIMLHKLKQPFNWQKLKEIWDDHCLAIGIHFLVAGILLGLSTPFPGKTIYLDK